MKRTIELIILTLMLGAFSAPVFAQSKECNDDNKRAWYQTFLDNRKGEAPQQKTAYEAAKDYLNCGGDDSDQIVQYLKKWVGEYERLTGAQAVSKQFEDAFKQKNYADQMRLGKQLLATDANNPAVNIILAVAGLSDPNYLNDSAQYARKSIQLIEAGKPFAPYESKDKALAAMNYAIAEATLKTSPTDAIPYFLKAAKYDSDLKRAYQLYYDLATAYEKGPGAKLTEAYKPFVGKDETDESKLALANLNQVVDRQIDALARAAALAQDANTKKAIMDDLTELYKYRNKSDAGLNELVAGVLNKPLPEMPTPLTSLPPSAGSPAASAAGANGASSTGTAVTSTGAQKQPATTGTAKPTPSPTPKSKPRTNFRRG